MCIINRHHHHHLRCTVHTEVWHTDISPTFMQPLTFAMRVQEWWKSLQHSAALEASSRRAPSCGADSRRLEPSLLSGAHLFARLRKLLLTFWGVKMSRHVAKLDRGLHPGL